MTKSPLLLFLAVALISTTAVTGCGGGSSNSAERLTYSQAETSIKKYAEENMSVSVYSSVSIGRCNQNSAKSVSCVYVYHKEVGGFDQYETREAEATLTPNGYTSITDKGRVGE